MLCLNIEIRSFDIDIIV